MHSLDAIDTSNWVTTHVGRMLLLSHGADAVRLLGVKLRFAFRESHFTLGLTSGMA